MRSELAPIVLFVYKRPEHTRKTIKALRKNYLASESELDGWKDDKDKPDVGKVRNYLLAITGFLNN